MNTLLSAAEWLSGVLWTLSWQITVLVLIVWVVSLTSRRAAPNFRYWLWCIVLARLCIPATLALPWGVSGEVRQAVEISAPQVLLLARQTVPFPWVSPRNAIDSPASLTEETLPEPAVAGTAPRHVSIRAALGLLWICVSLGLLTVVVARNIQAHHTLRHMAKVTRPELLQLVDSLRSKCAIRRPVRLRTFPAGQTAYGPAVVGVMRPTIVLPAHIAQLWSLDEIEPVLLHEFAHIQRWDLLFNWVQMLIQSVYFFHPLVWFANSKIRQERELVCDDVAVHLLLGQSKRYSRSFVRVIEDASDDSATFQLAGVGMTEHRKPLARRIIRMVSKDYRLYRPLGWLSVTVLLFVSAAAIAVAAERAVSDNAGADSEPPESVAEFRYGDGLGGAASLSGRVVVKKPDEPAGAKVILARLKPVEEIGADVFELEVRRKGDNSPAAETGKDIEKRDYVFVPAVGRMVTEVAADGSFEFKDIPGGTYFLSVKPQGRDVIEDMNGGWRLIDLGPTGHKSHVVLKLFRWKDEKAEGGYTFSLDVPQLEAGTTWSTLPEDLRRQAEEGFASQHDNWLGIRRLSAAYRWTTRNMENGEWTQNEPRTGTMAFEVISLTREKAKELGHPLQLQISWRAHDNELKWNAASHDIVGGPQRMVYWQDGHDSEHSNTPPEQGMLPWHMFTMIYTVMGASYGEGSDSGCTRDEYFRTVTPAIRLSTDEEARELLGGEKSYMFFAWIAQPRMWISANTGKLHQIDMATPGVAGLATTRYENYVEDPESKLSFPSRVIWTVIHAQGFPRKKTEQTIEFSEVHINPEVAPDIE